MAMTPGEHRRPARGLVAAAALALAGPVAAAEVQVGGYAKLDLMWSNRIAGGGGGTTGEVAGGPSAVPLSSEVQARHQDTSVSARQSRVNVTGKGEVEAVKVKGFIEVDLHSNDGSAFVSNSRHLRLRHAYGMASLPSGLFVLGGQSWTNFMDIETFYDTIDFNGPAGQLFGRQPQLRIGYARRGVTLTASVESAATSSNGDILSGLSPDGEPGGAQSQGLPLMTAKVVWAPSFMTAVAAGAVGQNRAIFGARDRSTTTWAAQLGVALPVPGTPFTLKGNVNHLDGLNRVANGDFADAAVVGADRIENIETTGAYVGGNLKVTETTAVNGYFGWRLASRAVASDGEDKLHQTVHVNVMQKLWGNLEAGLEYQFARRELFNGDAGSMNRVQGAWYYYF